MFTAGRRREREGESYIDNSPTSLNATCTLVRSQAFYDISSQLLLLPLVAIVCIYYWNCLPNHLPFLTYYIEYLIV